MKRLWKDKKGSIAVYAAVFSVLALSAGSIAIDLGRIVTLRAQMQHRADAGALAAAVYLDGSPGARRRAIDVARNATTDLSGVSSDKDELVVATVNFYSEWEPVPVAATSDDNARIIEVILEPRQVGFFFTPFFGMIVQSQQSNDQATVNASSVAEPGPLMCNSPPLMMCDLSEVDSARNVLDENNIGKLLLLKGPQGGNSSWAPGNFAMLETPDGDSGASAIAANLAAVEPPGCTGPFVTTAPGSKTNQSAHGANARFSGTRYPYPSQNIIPYPRDGNSSDYEYDNARLGNGNWDQEGYWLANHGTNDVPDEIDGGTRYQTHIYESGEVFAVNGNKTLYPVDANNVPAGYNLVIPPGASIPAAGQPMSAPAPNGPRRRVVQVAVLRCISDNVIGSGTYDPKGRYVEVFVTEPVQTSPEAAIYGEIIGRITPQNSDFLHANTMLVE